MSLQIQTAIIKITVLGVIVLLIALFSARSNTGASSTRVLVYSSDDYKYADGPGLFGLLFRMALAFLAPASVFFYHLHHYPLSVLQCCAYLASSILLIFAVCVRNSFKSIRGTACQCNETLTLAEYRSRKLAALRCILAASVIGLVFAIFIPTRPSGRG